MDHSTIRRILIIRQHDMMGDFILATPVFRALRLQFPNAHIGVLVQAQFREIVLDNPHVDEVLVFQKNLGQWTAGRIWEFLKSLLWRWDLSVVLNTVSHSLTSDILALLSGSRHILGSERPFLHSCSRNFLYNIIAPISSNRIHQSERNVEIVRYLGAPADSISEEMYLQQVELTRARFMLEQHGITRQHPVVALHVGAGKVGNRWPVARFAELAERMHNDLQADVALCWGPNEIGLASEFERLVSFPFLRFPPGPLRQLAALFRQCDLLVCNDTGVMHICAAVEVPLVAVFGPTDANLWKPVGDAFMAIQGVDGTVESVSVDLVYDAVGKAIRLRRQRESPSPTTQHSPGKGQRP